MPYRVKEGRVLFSLRPEHEQAFEADGASFRALNENYGADASRVFFQGATVEGAAAGTFEALGAFHGRDARHVFWRSRVIECASPSSFRALGWDYGRDGTMIFECAVELKGVDASSFEVLDEGYTRDHTGVYHFGRRVPDVPPSEVEVWGPYVRLGTLCTYRGTPIAGADASSFRGLDAGDYAVDTSRVYYAGVPVRGADVSSFEAMGPALASDKSKMYVGGDRYEGEIGADWNVLDIASLRSRVIEHQFAKSAAEGDASAMSALARNALKQDDAYQALVWARIVPIFGGKRLKKLEDEARYMLDPHEELPELVPDVSLSTAKMLWIGTEVPRRSEEARLHLANALREGLLTLTTFTRESLVEQFGEEVVVSAEAIASGPPARKRTAKSGSS